MARSSWKTYQDQDKRQIAIEALRAMAVDGKPPQIKVYQRTRLEWMPSANSIVKWMECGWSDACDIALGTADEVSDTDLDRMAATGEFLGIDKRLVKGWLYGCKIAKNPGEGKPCKIWDWSQHRWIFTVRHTGYMTV